MSTSSPQNLLFIMSDQHNKHMVGCYGNRIVKTPAIDSLAERGTRFKHAYCNSPVCVPSRAAMVSGDYAFRGGYWDNACGYGGESDSFATRLHQQGHAVTAIGKMHLRSDTPKTGFLDQRIPIHMINGEGDIYGCIRTKTISRPQFYKTLAQAGPGETDYTRYDREVARLAAEFLQNEASGKDKPFVLYVGFVSPHFPLTVPQQYYDMYPLDMLSDPIESDEALWPHHPVLDDYRRYCHMEEVPRSVRMNALRTYLGMCSFLDDQVGRVLSALCSAGLEDSTRVLYATDHGDTMGEHGLFYKSTMYEGSVGIPMIMAGPEVPSGKVSETAVSLIDVYPTVLHCVGATANEHDLKLPGESLLTIAQEETVRQRTIFSEYHAFGVYTATCMVRTGKYKYVHYVGERPQLFDLEQDPAETVDLAADEGHAEVLKAMEAELRSIADPEELDRQAKAAQQAVLARYGGEAEFLRNFKPALFTPVPKGI
jgi:choline-sulfatase